MDRQKIIAALVERHGLKLDPHDPAFLIVDLNLLMLEGQMKTLNAVAAQISLLPTTAGQKLQEQTNQFLKASSSIQQDLTRLAKAVDTHTNKTVDNAVKSAQSEIQRAAADALSNAMSNSGVDEKVGSMVNEIHQAAQALSAHTAALGNKQASKTPAKSPLKLIAIIAATSLIAALIGGSMARFSPSEQRSVLSAEDSRHLETGRALDKIWPALTEKEQQRINGLMQAQ
jgi:hypothetical protein